MIIEGCGMKPPWVVLGPRDGEALRLRPPSRSGNVTIKVDRKTVGEKGDPTRLRVFRPDREIWRLNQEAIMEVACRSLTGDGVLSLLVKRLVKRDSS